MLLTSIVAVVPSMNSIFHLPRWHLAAVASIQNSLPLFLKLKMCEKIILEKMDFIISTFISSTYCQSAIRILNLTNQHG